MGFFVVSKTLNKQAYSENAMMACLEQQNPRIQSSDTES